MRFEANTDGWSDAALERHRDHPRGYEAPRPTPVRAAPAERLRQDDDHHELSLDALWSRLNDPRRRPTPEVTVQAVLYAVRRRGTRALKEEATRERLSRCDDAALARINEQVAKLKASGKC